MGEVHGERQIRGRQAVPDRIGPEDGKRRVRIGRRIQVHTEDFQGKPALNIAQHTPVPAADIQNTAYRQRVAANGCDERPGVTQEAVNVGQILIGAADQVFGHVAAIEDFDLKRLPHRFQLPG